MHFHLLSHIGQNIMHPFRHSESDILCMHTSLKTILQSGLMEMCQPDSKIQTLDLDHKVCCTVPTHLKHHAGT